MHTLELIVFLIASCASLVIGLFSYLRNHRNLTHRLFGILTFTLVGWTGANYISILLTEPQQIFVAVRAVLFFVVLQNTCFFLFVSTFPGNTLNLPKKISAAYLGFSGLTLFASVYPGFFKGYEAVGDFISPQASPFMSLFMLHTFISIGGGIRKLSQRYRRSVGLVRNQFRFLILASAVLLLLAPFTNFLLPVVFGVTTFVPYGPLYTLAFSSVIAYTIVAQKLFDIKLVVARSVAYFLSLGLLAVIYAGVTSTLANRALSGISSNSVLLLVNTLGFLFAVLLYPYIKNFFDKVTNKLFYQDAYDTQAFLDQLNRVLVGNVELELLLKQVSRVIADNLRVEFCLFWIDKTSYLPRRTISANRHRLADKDVDEIRAFALHSRHRVLVVDELSTDSRLRALLGDSEVAVLAPIASKTKDRGTGIGYMVLGQKKSGNIYNSQDVKLIEIVANELVIATQNAIRFEEIEHFNLTLQEKIDERTRQLRRTNERLKLLDQTKDDFISMASHQLRTPLTSVKGYLSMVLEGDAGKLNEKEKKLLTQAFSSSQRMVYLIADLLNVSRLKTGKFVVEATATNLADIVQGEVEQLVETAASRNLKLTYEKPKDFPLLMFDETKIRQVIMNFIDNAVHYTPSGGHIKVSLEESGSSVEFKVIDDGLGVPKHEQHHLFTKFYRAGNAKKARPDGTGLGLFMAKKVIIAQGGSIIFQSQEGKGSTFGFTFAKARLQPQESDRT